MSEENPLSFGIVDVGTNAVRFEIYQSSAAAGSGAIAQRVYQRREVFRLGETFGQTQRINAAVIPALLSAFRSFAELTAKQAVCSIKAVGTSIFREAVDAEEIRELIQRESAISIDIISGAREARLIAEGILHFEPDLPAECLFIDIGGGSTEISASANGQILFSQSLPIGAIKAQKEFLLTAHPSAEVCAALRHKIAEELRQVPTDVFTSDGGKNGRIAVCSSGTARALADLREHAAFSCAWLNQLIQTLLPLEERQIKTMLGAREERADIILAGALLLQQMLLHIGAEQVRVSAYSLRHGLLVESLREAGLVH